MPIADPIAEARRQAEICNACRYCEGYCAVFPAMHQNRSFAKGDITQLANLCHDCRGCFYACQYTEPHEFAVNLPRALAEVRQETWQRLAWPQGFARLFAQSGVAIAILAILGFAGLIAAMQLVRPETGAGFYAEMSHDLMVAIFAPAFALPLMAQSVAIRRYWAETGGGPVRLADMGAACRAAVTMKNLTGGHGQGCNFEDEDRFSQARRRAHQATLWGFLLCFAATASGTLMHYGFGIEAPYPLFSVPKLFGLPGGVLLCLGTAALAWLKTQADPGLGARRVWGGEMAFILMLFAVSATGLALFAATSTSAVRWLLAVHLGCVLALFLLTPYSKMVHGAYRLAALTQDAARTRRAGGTSG